MLDNLFTAILNITQGLGYWGVGLLMAIESSFLPLPSEIVIPPAAYLASQGKMNLILVILFGIIGSIVGAIFNYVLSLYLGRPLVYKLAAHPYARYLFISPAKIERAEKYFLNNSKSATFIGRLIPVIRHLISIPAGFSRMPLGKFILYTALGSAVWVSLLAYLGYFIGSNQELFIKYYQELSFVLVGLGLIWLFWKIRSVRKRKIT